MLLVDQVLVVSSQDSLSQVNPKIVPTDDASVHAFLQSVSSRLAQVGHGLPRNLFKRHEENVPIQSTDSTQTLVLPDKDTAKGYMEAYFEHGNATCRFLPPRETYEKLDWLYEHPNSEMHTQVDKAIVLLVIATGYSSL